MTHPLIEQNKDEIKRFCKAHQVSRLDLFGSATETRFDPARSDLDFVVTFEELSAGKRTDAYFGLLEALEELLGRPVDLVMESAVSNPYILYGMLRNKAQLYAT